LRNEGLTFASANMPDTKTQAEGTPCSLVLQPNSINKGWSTYGKQWTEIWNVYEKDMPREGLGRTRPTGQPLDISNRVME